MCLIISKIIIQYHQNIFKTQGDSDSVNFAKNLLVQVKFQNQRVLNSISDVQKLDRQNFKLLLKLAIQSVKKLQKLNLLAPLQIRQLMKQTSLLDSFIKKANKQTNQTVSSQSDSSKVITNLCDNLSIKQNNVNTNSSEKSLNKSKEFETHHKKQNINKNESILKQGRQAQGKAQKKSYANQKMEVENPYFSNDEPKQQFKGQRLKKIAVSQSKLNDSQKKPNIHSFKSTNQKRRNKKLDIDSDFSQQNQQPQQSQPFNYDCDSFPQDSDEQAFEQQFIKKSKKKSQKIQSTNKKQIVKKNNKIQSFIKKESKSIIQNNDPDNPNAGEGQICQTTQNFDRSKFTDATPDWAIPGHPKCKDKYGVSCKSENYDQTTLYIPQSVWDTASAPMKQYWRIKSENFDKVIFFKLGKFYQLFYEDALIGNQLLDLKWMATKMHVGFPEKSLQRYTKQLVRHGLKVVVVEQMQTPEQMNNRIQEEKKKGIKSQKTLRRQVTQIITKGTIQQKEEQQSYLPNYLISVYRYEKYIAYTLLEVGTNLILLGIVEGFQQFKTILYQTRPSEILYDPDNLPRDYVNIMKENIQGMILSKLMNKQNLWHHLNAQNQLEQLEQKGILKKSQVIETIYKFDSVPKNLMISTLSGLFEYLHRIFKFQYVLSTAKFKFYQKQKSLTHMVLDSQALQHLEVFQTALGQPGSLFQKIQRTKTKFGKRLFRRWMTSPLLSVYQINQRLNALEDLKQLGKQLDQIQGILSKLPDLQKICNRLYKYSVTNTSAATAVYFQDLNTTRLKQFDNFMKNMEDSIKVFKSLNDNMEHFKSKRLHKLITINKNQQSLKRQNMIYFEDEEFLQQQHPQTRGLLPDIISHLHSFKQYVIWRDSKPYPKQGVIPTYDGLVKNEKQVIKKLNNQLEKIRKEFKCPDINFVHIKERYEVQIPERKNIKIPQQYSFSSKKAGYSRYLVPEIQQIVSQLQIVQKGIKTQMGIFVTFFFEQFKQKQNIWERYINILAQIDCFAGMAQFAKQRKTCRPEFIQNGFQVIDGVHPSLYNIDFVPNNIDFKDPIIILTGPNMGGKSTVLRTSCLLALMAQMGCYVTARSYKASIIDRIFTRIGASDKLQAGKSTFFIQMQQTKSIVNYATNRSLAIIDQLGRGTATFDGMALAHSVLNFMIHKIGCKCMFATHYHSLTQQFASMPGTCLKMMDYQIVEGEQDRIEFLYKLVNGKAQKSFGINVAQLVGLPKALIKVAKEKSNQMHEQIEIKKKKIRINQFLQRIKTKR